VPQVGGGSPSVTVTYSYSAAAGGVVVARDSTIYPPHPYVGQLVYDIALATILRWNGTAWLLPKGTAYRGTWSGTSDASGYLVVTHGLPFTPSAVQVSGASGYSGTTQIVLGADQITSTTFRVRVLTLAATSPAGDYHVQLRASQLVGGDWRAYE
jgi:hypothetical protein